MSRHKMSLSVNYVPSWGVQDALRELFQNCIDHGDWEYKLHSDTLILRSKNAALTARTLLLGHSPKRGDSTKIGTHGEGYKLASLVLARLGYEVTIDTADEVWKPKLIDSRTYGTKQLVFDTNKSSVTMTDLVFTISGLTDYDIAALRFRNLYVAPMIVQKTTEYGEVIDRPGDVFINGLYVCNMEGFKFGYNFKPEYLQLDRDRRVVREFDMKWLTSQLWRDCEDYDTVIEMIKAKVPDVEHLEFFMTSVQQGLADAAAKAFAVDHGVDAVPVVSQGDIDAAKDQGHSNIILVPAVQRDLLDRSPYYVRPAPRIVKKTPREELLEHRVKHADNMHDDELADFDILLEKAKRWSS